MISMYMYADFILFAIGALFAAITVFFAAYLFLSRKKSRAYTEILNQETEIFDALTATASILKNYSENPPYISDTGEMLTDIKTERFATEVINVAETADGTVKMPFEVQKVMPGLKGVFDESTIAGVYEIEQEIGGGNMSRTFRVRSVKLGNPWFLKFISSEDGGLSNEENILKMLNHASLPRIIDVYHKDEGVYLVETLVEGVSLDMIGKTEVKVNSYIIADWFEQLAQSLNYLHEMKPSPIYHLDIKPRNIMITHDNRLVLVDFGISRRSGEGGLGAVTAQYAAPEQFGARIPDKYSKIVAERFGSDFEPDRGAVDARTDIYGLGAVIFELATGQSPFVKNLRLIDNISSNELKKIVLKCLEINPEDRYQSAVELLEDLRRIKNSKIKMVRALLTRRLSAVAAVLAFMISCGTFGGGYFVYARENTADVYSQPEVITLSLRQSMDISLEKRMPDGEIFDIESSRIRWEFSNDNVARLSGNKITGVNEGKTVIRGNYRNKTIYLDVRVVIPMDGLTEISQFYEPGRTVTLYAGTAERERTDGPLETADFFSPESITASDDGTVYLSDAGVVRKITGSEIKTIEISPQFITAAIVRSYDNDLYVLSNPWQDGDAYRYAIARINGGEAEALYIADARYTAVEDFKFYKDNLYFIDRNEGLGAIHLKTINLYDVEEITTLCKLPSGAGSVAIADDGVVYIGNKDAGTIYVYRENRLESFAGIEGERAFIDGFSPRFYSPQKLEHAGGYLIVWDFNTLRRIEAKNGIAGECVTLAGMASPDFKMQDYENRSAAEDSILTYGALTDFALTENAFLLTDHKRGVVWKIR